MEIFEMKKKKTIWVILLVVVLLGGGGYFYYDNFYKVEEVQAVSSLQSTRAQRGELVIYASGSGTIVATEEYELSFPTSGLLSELNVKVGDRVKKGDILARLGELEDLQATIAAYELNVLTAQKDLEDIYNSLDADFAQAQLDVVDAQLALEDAKEAREVLNYARCSQELIGEYYTEMIDSTNLVNELQNAGIDDVRLDEAVSTKTTATANYYYCVMARTDSEIMEGDANVALAEANLKTAENTMATLEEGPDPYEIMLAEAEVSNAQAQLEAAKEDLENATMLAPIDGTILTVEAKAGELVGTSTVITIGDLDHPLLEVLMDESDLDSVKVGYECEVIFDAFPDETYPAVVTQVDPQLTTVGNTNAVRAEVQLDAAYIPASVTFPIGLNALVDVIGGKTENAILVPVEALREIDTDEYAVFVLVDGEPELRMVEVGLMDYTYAEILSGVEAGETVTTGIVETN